jgi:hypothetical protein
MNPALIAFAIRSLFRLFQEVPAARSDVEAQTDNFGKGMAALAHLENVFGDLHGDYETHAAAVGVPVAPVAGK